MKKQDIVKCRVRITKLYHGNLDVTRFDLQELARFIKNIEGIDNVDFPIENIDKIDTLKYIGRTKNINLTFGPKSSTIEKIMDEAGAVCTNIQGFECLTGLKEIGSLVFPLLKTIHFGAHKQLSKIRMFSFGVVTTVTGLQHLSALETFGIGSFSNVTGDITLHERMRNKKYASNFLLANVTYVTPSSG